MLTDQPAGISRLEHAATVGVVLLALGSFVLSYDALHQLAVHNHAPKPLAWIWPLIVDGFIITASLAVLHAVLRERAVVYPWLLVLAFSAVSVVFNVLHAPSTIVARLVAAIPPLTLVLSFELLMRQLRDRFSELTKAPATPSPQPDREVAIAESPQPTEVPNAVTTGGVVTTSRSMLQQARQLHESHQRDGAKLTGKMLGGILGVSDGYARRLLREINAAESATPVTTASGM